MNRKKILYLITTITLVFSVLSCSNDTDNNLETEKVTPTEKITPQASQQPSTPEIAQQPSTPPQIAQQPSTPQADRAAVAPSVDTDPAKAAKLTDDAKFLAGINVDGKSPLASREKNQVWKNHAQYFNNVWVRLEKQQLSKIRNWSDKELKLVNQSSKVIFYPFSGPDFLYSYSFFPQGNIYVLAGLEPVGSIPDFEKISADETNRSLQRVEQSLRAILQWSFFLTNDMKVDLSEKGVLPILFVFLARTKNQILDMQYIGLRKDATVQVLDKDNKEKLIPGVKIDFVPEGEYQPRTLYYFSGDLSDSGLKKAPEFKKFVQSLGKSITYLKAASYLLHYDSFSNMRNLILSQSTALLQDDSGIPIRYFDNSKWKLQFYGNYTQPISLFSNEYQGALKSIYQSKTNVKPLDFGIGYRYQVNDSNLMLGIHK